jgi:hypothetical protein
LINKIASIFIIVVQFNGPLKVLMDKMVGMTLNQSKVIQYQTQPKEQLTKYSKQSESWELKKRIQAKEAHIWAMRVKA